MITMAKVECELMTQDAIDVEIGGKGVILQAKSVEITENGTSVVAPDDGFDGLKSVEINTNVPKRFECGDAYFVPPASGATSISLMIFLQKINVSCWDTSKFTSFKDMFVKCSNLQSIDVSGWDTSSVTNISSMFYGCSSLTSLDLNNWNTSNIQNINGTFREMVNLKMLNISNWDTSSVTNISYMFCGAKLLPKVDFSSWDASNVTNTYYMFYETLGSCLELKQKFFKICHKIQEKW